MILQDNKIYFKNIQVDTILLIPKGNWLVRYDEKDCFFFLEKMNDFSLPNKIYGNCDYLTDRYLSTFKKYNKNLGISLSGVKGTGKSLTAKMLAMKSNLPTIIINEPFNGSEFNSFIEGIKQECIVFIDEFEKVYYKNEDQEMMLTLLDGAFESKKMFLFTSNDTSRFNNHLMNRPGRIHYYKEYNRIDDQTLQEIIDDALVDKTKEDGLKSIINLIDDANIDMVFSLIREMNDFNEDAREAVQYLNVNISNKSKYEVTIQTNNNFVYFGDINVNPFFYGKLDAYLSIDFDLSLSLGKTRDEIEKVNDSEGYERRFIINIEECKIIKSDFQLSQLKDKRNNIITIKKVSPYQFVF